MNKMKRKSIFSRIALCAVSLTMVASVSACGKSDAGNTNGKIAVITKSDKVSFWSEVQKGSQDACDEYGYEMLYYAASGDNDYASQQEYINDAIKQEVNAIVIAPNDPKELNDSFKKAEAAGIKLININSRADYDGISALVASSDSDAGKVAARNAYKLLMAANNAENGAGGSTIVSKIAIIGHTAATADERVNSFKEDFADRLGNYIDKQRTAMMQAQAAQAAAAEGGEGSEGGDASSAGGPPAGATGGPPAGATGDASAAGGDSSQASGMKQRAEGETASMISQFFIEGERCSTIDAAYEEAKLLINENPDIRIMYGTNTNTTLGICKAVEELDLGSSIIVVGFNSDEAELKYIRSGILDGTVIQNPYTMGYISIKFAKDVAAGKGVATKLDTGVTWIDASNLNQDLVQALLYPEKIGG